MTIVCDVSSCRHLALWTYIGEGAPLYLCAHHFNETTKRVRAPGWHSLNDQVEVTDP